VVNKCLDSVIGVYESSRELGYVLSLSEEDELCEELEKITARVKPSGVVLLDVKTGFAELLSATLE